MHLYHVQKKCVKGITLGVPQSVICICVTQSCTDGYVWNSSTCQCDAIPGEVVYGCTDPAATNYNSDANTSDGTCTYPSDEESE